MARRRSSGVVGGTRPDPRDDPDYQARIDAVAAKFDASVEKLKGRMALTYENSFEFSSKEEAHEFRRKNFPG